MDTLTLVEKAITTGAAFIGEKVVSEAVKDAYSRLKISLMNRLGKAETEAIQRTLPDETPEQWAKRVAELLRIKRADQDEAVVQNASEFLALLDKTHSISGKYNVSVEGGVKSLIQAEGSNINIRFGSRENDE